MIFDSFIGQVEVIPEIGGENVNDIKEEELCGRKKGHKRPGIMKFRIQTSENLKKF